MDVHISVRFFASLAQRMPPTPNRYAVSPGTTVREVLSAFDITEQEAKLVFVNNKRAELSSVLNNGDRVGVFPPVGGG